MIDALRLPSRVIIAPSRNVLWMISFHSPFHHRAAASDFHEPMKATENGQQQRIKTAVKKILNIPARLADKRKTILQQNFF